MDNFIQAILAALLISGISLVGLVALLNTANKIRHILYIFIAFAAGTLVGDVFFHLLPEYAEEFGITTEFGLLVVGSITAALLLEAYIHTSHDRHDPHYRDEHEGHHNPALATMNVLTDALHNLTDGLAIGASFIASPISGLATTIAIIFHEVPQELADNAILLHAGWDKRKVILTNFATALTAVLGVVLTFFLVENSVGAERMILPIAIGQFIYIALADLLPEIHKHKQMTYYGVQVSVFILGLVTMWMLTWLEV